MRNDEEEEQEEEQEADLQGGAHVHEQVGAEGGRQALEGLELVVRQLDLSRRRRPGVSHF